MTNILDFEVGNGKKSPEMDIPKRAEIINLGDLLQGPAERTRFIPIENQNPSFTKRIDSYRQRVQSGIGNITNHNFPAVFDTIYRIYITIRDSKFEVSFPKDEIVDGIQLLSLFECRYLVNGINRAIYPELETNTDPRMAYLHIIKAYLEKRISNLNEQFQEAS